MSDFNYTFDARCRWCLVPGKFAYAPRSLTTYQQFSAAMQVKIQTPPVLACANCGIHTVHEVLAYDAEGPANPAHALTESG